MKKLIMLNTITLLTFTQLVFADCATTMSYGQINEECMQSNNSSSGRSIEFTQIPYNANTQISNGRDKQRHIASLEQSVKHAHESESPFEPTHTQLNQVRQLLDYAKSQGCIWGGKFDQPLLVCPN